MAAPRSPALRGAAAAALRLGRNVEATALVLSSLVVIALWALAELADEVLEGATRDLDRDLLLLLRVPGDLSDPVGPPVLEEIMRDLTALGGIAALTLATVTVAVFFLLTRRYGQMAFVLVTIGGGILLSGLAKDLFDRPRPDLVPHGSLVHTASFPSGHAMMAAGAYLGLGALVARLQPTRRMKAYVMGVAVTITLAVGTSRVYLGVHWPTDVAAGWLAGAAWALLCLIAARALAARRRAATP
ncbi:MAG: phosphatase PAP2 family protein [Paracoccaceae bacterium]|jgi:undecaprenyl-diphosphatase|nr:phosphatase PAP2 family protein [Paracoccaceae bacterium]